MKKEAKTPERITRDEFMAAPDTYIGRDRSTEILNLDGSTLMFIAGRPHLRGFRCLLNKWYVDLWIWWQCRGIDTKEPLDASWLE